MKILKISDAIKATPDSTDCIWEWDGHRLEFMHYLSVADLEAGVLTNVDLDGESIWSASRECTIYEVWPHISVVLLSYFVMCEPLTSDNVEYSLNEIVDED